MKYTENHFVTFRKQSLKKTPKVVEVTVAPELNLFFFFGEAFTMTQSNLILRTVPLK